MTKRAEATPAAVPQAQQAGEILSRWRWVEPSVWTVRMLAALEHGVEGGKWFRLFDKVFAERNLLAAFQRVARNGGAAGVDHVTTRDFQRQLPEAIWELSDLLRSGRFQPQAIRRTEIPKPGSKETRPLGIPTVRDRVVQAAVVQVIAPIFERDFAEHSYGFRPGRSAQDALHRVDQLLRQGYVHVVDADLKSYFDTIPHDRLMARVEEKIADGPVLRLIASFLEAEILGEMDQWTPTCGTPQGAVLSPLLSNIYLDPLDHRMQDAGFEMVRYADDFVILCRSAEDAQRALAMVTEWVAANGLALHPTKTRIADATTEGFDFLGYHFRGTAHWVRKKSLAKLKDSLRVKTRRTSGRSLTQIVASVNRTLRGWFAYFRQSNLADFQEIDGWLRQRLRAILMKRRKRRGVPKGGAFRLWDNAFFAKHGLFSLVTAHRLVGQSSWR